MTTTLQRDLDGSTSMNPKILEEIEQYLSAWLKLMRDPPVESYILWKFMAGDQNGQLNNVLQNEEQREWAAEECHRATLCNNELGMENLRRTVEATAIIMDIIHEAFEVFANGRITFEADRPDCTAWVLALVKLMLLYHESKRISGESRRNLEVFEEFREAGMFG